MCINDKTQSTWRRTLWNTFKIISLYLSAIGKHLLSLRAEDLFTLKLITLTARSIVISTRTRSRSRRDMVPRDVTMAADECGTRQVSCGQTHFAFVTSISGNNSQSLTHPLLNPHILCCWLVGKSTNGDICIFQQALYIISKYYYNYNYYLLILAFQIVVIYINQDKIVLQMHKKISIYDTVSAGVNFYYRLVYYTRVFRSKCAFPRTDAFCSSFTDFKQSISSTCGKCLSNVSP